MKKKPLLTDEFLEELAKEINEEAEEISETKTEDQEKSSK